jgi:hypothetical protein
LEFRIHRAECEVGNVGTAFQQCQIDRIDCVYERHGQKRGVVFSTVVQERGAVPSVGQECGVVFSTVVQERGAVPSVSQKCHVIQGIVV